MKTDQEEPDQLTNNPFLKLFANEGQAKQYVEATKAGFERSQLSKQNSTESTSSAGSTSSSVKKNKLFDKISIGNKKFKKTVAERREIIINDFLQRIFLITVNPGMIIFSMILCGYCPVNECLLTQIPLNSRPVNECLLTRIPLNSH